jgi:hypothetical protein
MCRLLPALGTDVVIDFNVFSLIALNFIEAHLLTKATPAAGRL